MRDENSYCANVEPRISTLASRIGPTVGQRCNYLANLANL